MIHVRLLKSASFGYSFIFVIDSIVLTISSRLALSQYLPNLDPFVPNMFGNCLDVASKGCETIS